MTDSTRHDRAWQALVALYTLLTMVAGVAAVTSEFGQRPARLPQLAPPVVASERTKSVAVLPPGHEAVIPLGRLAIHLPILQYHYIRVVNKSKDLLGWNLSVTPRDFTAQMDWLQSHGYHPVTLDDVRAYFLGQQVLPAKPVVLTFDDGYQNFWSVAEPILLAHNFRAVAYIVPGFWGQSWYMTPEEVQILDSTGMVEIASHTMNHADIASTSPATRAYQLDVSKATLEKLLGHPVLDFCYPSGKFNVAAAAAVEAAGYQTATTEIPGAILSWTTRSIWPRVRVAGGENLATFVQNLGQPEPTINIVVEPIPPPSTPNGMS